MALVTLTFNSLAFEPLPEDFKQTSTRSKGKNYQLK